MWQRTRRDYCSAVNARGGWSSKPPLFRGASAAAAMHQSGAYEWTPEKRGKRVFGVLAAWEFLSRWMQMAVSVAPILPIVTRLATINDPSMLAQKSNELLLM